MARLLGTSLRDSVTWRPGVLKPGVAGLEQAGVCMRARDIVKVALWALPTGVCGENHPRNTSESNFEAPIYITL